MLLDTYMFLKLTSAKTLVPASKYAIPKQAYKVDRDGSIAFWVVSNLRIHFDPQTIQRPCTNYKYTQRISLLLRYVARMNCVYLHAIKHLFYPKPICFTLGAGLLLERSQIFSTAGLGWIFQSMICNFNMLNSLNASIN